MPCKIAGLYMNVSADLTIIIVKNSLGGCNSNNMSLEVLHFLVFRARLVDQRCAVASVWRPLLPKVASAPRVGGTTGSHLSIFVVFGERSGSAKRHS